MRLQLSLFLGLFLGCATAKVPAAPTEALELRLPDLQGQSVDLAAARGKVVLVDFWATWCKPCEASFPFYAELLERHQKRGFELWAVSVDVDDQAVQAFLQTHPVPFRILRDPEGKVPERLDLRTMPTAFLVGRDGRVRLVHAGFVDDDRMTLDAAIVAALAEPAVATSTISSP
jgi:cytochrome c biogenesis protein CcmG/thiol:disulfide interchange protein DsbE